MDTLTSPEKVQLTVSLNDSLCDCVANGMAPSFCAASRRLFVLIFFVTYLSLRCIPDDVMIFLTYPRVNEVASTIQLNCWVDGDDPKHIFRVKID
jgi:hypothetical protein